MGRISHVRFFHSDWRSALLGMTLEQEGLLIRICAYQWESGRRLPLDEWQAAHALGLNPKNFRRVFAELLSLGKVTAHADGYGSERAEAELAAAVSATGHDRQASRIGKNRAKTARQSRKDCETIANQSPILARTCEGIQSPPIEPITNTQEPIPPSPPKRGKGRKARDFRRELCQVAFDRYCAMADPIGLSVPRATSFETYAGEIFARLVEHGGAEASDAELLAIWDEALRKVTISSWLRGNNDRQFKASLSFMCQAKSFRKLLSGDYGNGAHVSPYQAKSDGLTAEQRARVNKALQERSMEAGHA